MKLVLGLGNPEEAYRLTRHNLGFRVLTQYAEQQGATFTLKAKFKACLAELTVGDEKILLAKPTTYYNLVGESYRSLCDFYRIVPEDTLIVHDELALPFGRLRARSGGSDAGNNGVKSIIVHGGAGSVRLRIGIDQPGRQPEDPADYVLARFTNSEEAVLGPVLEVATASIDRFIAGNLSATTEQPGSGPEAA